jgi:soluble lytic murein transglycosylase
MLALGVLLWAAPVAAAQDSSDPLAPLTGTKTGAPSYPLPAAPTRPPAVAPPAPTVGVPTIAVPKDWRGVFDAIDAGNWPSAQAGIDTLPNDTLTPYAKAELYTAKGSPVVDLGSLQALIAQAPELPQADQLALMAVKRGSTMPMPVLPEKPVYNLGSAPIRYKAKPVQGEPVADQLRAALDPLIKADDASGAEAQLVALGPQLSTEARAEAGQRVALGFYFLGVCVL